MTYEERQLKQVEKSKRDLAIHIADGFVNEIFDRMKKANYPEWLQLAVMSQVKNQLL